MREQTNEEVFKTPEARLAAFSGVCTLMQGTGQCRCTLKDRMPHDKGKEKCLLTWLGMLARDTSDTAAQLTDADIIRYINDMEAPERPTQQQRDIAAVLREFLRMRQQTQKA